MHLVESVSKIIDITPVLHEVSAGIASEYYCASSLRKAFALVTTGPGLTNMVTAFAGAYTEGRELLVIGGQVKTEDLANGSVRQRGIQEIDGVGIVRPISKAAVQIKTPISRARFFSLVAQSWTPKKGPVFLEIPLDVQALEVNKEELEADPVRVKTGTVLPKIDSKNYGLIVDKLRQALRPVILLGGGVDRNVAWNRRNELTKLGIPIMTTYNGADRIGSDDPMYFGRPNTWGQRYSNILIQQSDLVLALGTRLGLQQTGFNWQGFVPKGEIVQVDIDLDELNKGHPIVAVKVQADANDLLERLCIETFTKQSEWLTFCRNVEELLPLNEPASNQCYQGYINPYQFFTAISDLSCADDIVIPCSSGGAFTCAYQAFTQKTGQIMLSNKSLASMGYGLAGAIGASLANRDKRVILFEGDGGFAQNMQELGTVEVSQINLKIFVFDDQGYASIRMTQRNYFGGRYVGCDRQTGLGLPDWNGVFHSFGVNCMRLYPGFEVSEEFLKSFNAEKPQAYLVTIHPEQTYFPKISSRIKRSGGMESNPLHLMTPDLPEGLKCRVLKYI